MSWSTRSVSTPKRLADASDVISHVALTAAGIVAPGALDVCHTAGVFS